MQLLDLSCLQQMPKASISLDDPATTVSHLTGFRPKNQVKFEQIEPSAKRQKLMDDIV